jgi:hypothetical protein
VQEIFSRIERQPLLFSCLDGEHQLAGNDVLADLGDCKERRSGELTIGVQHA